MAMPRQCRDADTACIQTMQSQVPYCCTIQNVRAGRRVQLAHLSTFYRLPAIYVLRDFVEVGGLISYGADLIDSCRQAGRYAGRILKGTKPAELPIVKEDKFELVINTQTARMLGLTVPSSLLGRADEIID